MEDNTVITRSHEVLTSATSELEKASIGSPNRDDQIQTKGQEGAFHDGEIWDDESDENSNPESNLKREWNWRHNQFHTMGYREGITVGKKDSAQEGFNIGFKQSAPVGRKWGLIRGIISALASLPESSIEKLVPNIEMRQKLLDLFKSVKEISSDDALRIYHQVIIQNKSMQSFDSCDHSEEIFRSKDGNNSNKLEQQYRDLVILLGNCPEIKINSDLKI
ncbi:hypothetical protein LUZ60_003634 [Juncus effusus]|nr:hypothetical protein LUZ60_003634 [Juncus effusus]